MAANEMESDFNSYTTVTGRDSIQYALGGRVTPNCGRGTGKKNRNFPAENATTADL